MCLFLPSFLVIFPIVSPLLYFILYFTIYLFFNTFKIPKLHNSLGGMDEEEAISDGFHFVCIKAYFLKHQNMALRFKAKVWQNIYWLIRIINTHRFNNKEKHF
jgi:hypothetical protein